MSEPTILSYGRSAAAPHQRVGNVMLIFGAVFLVLGVPLLYAGGALGITAVNQLGRFLAVVIAAIGLDLVWGITRGFCPFARRCFSAWGVMR